MEHSPDERFRSLRVTVEAQLTMPAQIVVTSAACDDGTRYVADGLARAFAAAGRRTAMVDLTLGVADETATAESTAPAVRTAEGGEVRSVWMTESLDRVLLTGKRTATQAALIDILKRQVRDIYDVTIINADAVPESSVALELAKVSDAVLLAVRIGRALTVADREVMPALRRVGARVLGVVTTEPEKTDATDHHGVQAPERSPRINATVGLLRASTKEAIASADGNFARH